MNNAEQMELASAHRAAQAAQEAAAAMLLLASASMKWADMQPLRQYVAELREAERTAWSRYMAAALNTAADQAQRSLFVVSCIHEGSTALAA